MYKNYYAVIMAGGSGTRLWPLSRHDQPKQNLVFDGNQSLFQLAVTRLKGLFSPEQIFVVTVGDQVPELKKACPDLPLENFIIEPLSRGTASVAGLAALAIKNRDPNGVMAILPADHLIKNEDHLRQLLRAAYQVAETGMLVTLGITPSFPATGYGYIQKGEVISEHEGLPSYRVEKFKEKPDLDLAKTYVKDGQHVWNSGMFIWRVDTLLSVIGEQMPELYAKLDALDQSWSSASHDEVLASVWPTIYPQTIDYGIMENARNVAVIPSINLGWNDVGSWESLFEALEGDSEGNIILQGKTVRFDTQGTLICEDSADRLIVTMGVKDLVIIDSGKSLLICDRKHAQDVRSVVEFLKQNGLDQYL